MTAGLLLAGCRETGSRCLSLADEGRFPEAHACYQKVIKSNPGNAEIWHNAGLLLAIDGQYAAAQRCFLKTVDLKFNYPEAWYNLGLNYHHLKDPKNAVECFDRAIRQKPDNLPAWKQKCLLLGMSGGLFGITPADSLWMTKRGVSSKTGELLELEECRQKFPELIRR